MKKKISISLLLIILVVLPVIVFAAKKGDVNGDKKVDNLDLTVLKNYIKTKKKLSSSQLKRADINGDKKVNSKDVTALKKILSTATPQDTIPYTSSLLCYVDANNNYYWTDSPISNWNVIKDVKSKTECESKNVSLTSKPTPKPTPKPTAVPTPKTSTPTPTPIPSKCCCVTSNLKYCSWRNGNKCPNEQAYEDTTMKQCGGAPKTPTPTPKPAATTTPTPTPKPVTTPVIPVLPVPGVNAKNKIHFVRQPSQGSTETKLSAGDVILLESNGHFAMIDTGLNNEIDNTTVLNYLKSVGVSKLDFIVITHMHRDHVGGLKKIVKSIPVSKIYIKKDPVKGDAASTNILRDVKNLASKKKIKFVHPSKDGSSITFQQMKISFYNVAKSSLGGANGDSLLEYIKIDNKYKVLLTADLYDDSASIKYLKKLANNSKFQNLDLLKMPHHAYGKCAFADNEANVTFKKFNPKYIAVTKGKCTICNHINNLENELIKNEMIYGFKQIPNRTTEQIANLQSIVFSFGDSLTVTYK